MSKMYHIHPVTGVPNLCRARKGNCPYGGQSGSENHFNTFSEAQKYAQRMLEEKYSMLPSEDSEETMNQLNQKRKIPQEVIDKLMKRSHAQILIDINSTSNKQFISGVIEGELEFENWTYVGAALQNNHLPKEFINEVLFDYPEEFDDMTRLYTTSSHLLTYDEIENLIENDNNIEVSTLAMMNNNIRNSYVLNTIRDKTDDELSQLPYAAIFTDWKYKNNEEVNKVRERIQHREDYNKSRMTAERLLNRYINVKDKMKVRY